jgi:ATP-binding cassette, subfamily F, member 3
MKRLAKLAGTEAVRAERAMHIQFGQPAKLPHSLIRLNGADCGYEKTAILEHVGFGLEAGDRVGLLGPNGAGKSTLVKTLVGELPLLDGERVAHPDLRIGYFAQHTVESLTEGQSPIWHLKEIAPEAGEQALRNFLGQWYFVGDRAFEKVDGFSGGERARLALALIAYRQPNVLLLDEPTNHLDIDMREALAEALSDFDGAIVLVSHDRHLIGLVSETFWRVADGHVEPFNGDLDEYAVWLKARSNKADQAASKAKAETVKSGAAPKPQSELGKLQKQAEKLEKHMTDLDSQLAHIQDEMAKPELYQSDGGAVLLQLGQRQSKLLAERAAAEAEWLTVYETLEAG